MCVQNSVVRGEQHRLSAASSKEYSHDLPRGASTLPLLLKRTLQHGWDIPCSKKPRGRISLHLRMKEMKHHSANSVFLRDYNLSMDPK